MDDYRLFNYAMKAHGLEDMAYAKAFMRKVLESDLSDEESYANMLTDERYRKFAEAFSFSSATSVVQSDAQEDAVIGLYNQSFVNQDAAVKTDSAYFNAAIDLVTNADQIWQNDRLKTYVMTAFGLDPKYTSYEQFKGVITSDVSDPNSFVNAQAAAYQQGLEDRIANIQATATPEDLANANSSASKLIASYQTMINNAPDYTPLAAAFNFQLDGTLAPGDKPMSDAQKAATNEAYVFQQPRLSTTAALLDKMYYEATINTVTSVTDLLANTRLLNYVVVAYGLPSTTLMSTLENVLTSDPDDPLSYVNTATGEYKAVYQEMARAFNFQNDGTLAVRRYAANGNADGRHIGRLYRSLQRRLRSRRRRADLLLPDADEPRSWMSTTCLMTTRSWRWFCSPSVSKTRGDSARKLKKVLTSDLGDPEELCQQPEGQIAMSNWPRRSISMPMARWAPTSGAIRGGHPQHRFQPMWLKKAGFGTEDDKTARNERIDNITVPRSKRSPRSTISWAIAGSSTSFWWPPASIRRSVTTDYVRQMFESDLDDPDSFVNTEPETRYREIVASFNFNARGRDRPARYRPDPVSPRSARDQRSLSQPDSRRVRGRGNNAGVRLALYFKRMASRRRQCL